MSVSVGVKGKNDKNREEKEEMRVNGRYGRDSECSCTEFVPEKAREEGRFVVGALVCDVSGLLD